MRACTFVPSAAAVERVATRDDTRLDACVTKVLTDMDQAAAQVMILVVSVRERGGIRAKWAAPKV